jgi:hypothetical protein
MSFPLRTLWLVTVVSAIDYLCEVARRNAWNRVSSLDLFFDLVALSGSKDNFVPTLIFRATTRQARKQLEK